MCAELWFCIRFKEICAARKRVVLPPCATGGSFRANASKKVEFGTEMKRFKDNDGKGERFFFIVQILYSKLIFIWASWRTGCLPWAVGDGLLLWLLLSEDRRNSFWDKMDSAFRPFRRGSILYSAASFSFIAQHLPPHPTPRGQARSIRDLLRRKKTLGIKIS